MIKKYKKGFTLIELLVVVAIIGILASVVLVSLSSARAKARDVQRISDLKQIQNALAVYYGDHRSYPYTNGNWYGTCAYYGGYADWIPGLVPTYISKLPQDQSYDCSTYRTYLYASDGINYTVLDYNGPDNPSGQPNFIDCHYATSWSVKSSPSFRCP